MRTKICLAGFKGEELDSLKETFLNGNSVWDCHFAEDAKAVLDISGKGPLDVVVANLRMEGMNGAELLQKVGERCPSALRFIVSDLADRALTIDSISGTHQFVSRPLKARELASLIQRSIALDAWLANDQLRALIPKLRRLPSLPSTYFETLKQLENPSASADSVGAVIARDPAATARLLQMVNSTAYALERKVTDPTDAVCLLGMDTVKSLLLCMQVFGESDETRQAGLSIERLWSHSLAVGEIARRLTFAETRNNALASDAFTAGLLHDVGRIVLASNQPNTYSEVVAAAKASGRGLHEEEAIRFGVTHAQVGAYLLGVWGLPAALVEAAALHHCPGRSPSTEFSLLAAVHVANVFAYERSGDINSPSSARFDQQYLDALGLADKLDSWRNLAFGKQVAEPKPEANRKSAPAPVPVVASAPVRAAQTSHTPARNWLVNLLIPATAVGIISIAGFFWLSAKPRNEPIPVRAKTLQPPTAAPTTTVQEAPPTHEEKIAPSAAEPIPPAQAATVPSTDTAPTNAVVQALPVKSAPKEGFDSIKLQGIFYKANNPSVIINGETLKPGQQINGVMVISIQPSSVMLSYGGIRKVLQVE